MAYSANYAVDTLLFIFYFSLFFVPLPVVYA